MRSAGVDYPAITGHVKVRQAAGEDSESSVNKRRDSTSKVETCPVAGIEYERRGRRTSRERRGKQWIVVNSARAARDQSGGEAAGAASPGVAGRDTPNDRNRR